MKMRTGFIGLLVCLTTFAYVSSAQAAEATPVSAEKGAQVAPPSEAKALPAEALASADPTAPADATTAQQAAVPEQTPAPAQPALRPRPVPAPIYIPRPGTAEEVARRPPGPSEPGYIINTAQGDTLTVGGYLHVDGRLYTGQGAGIYEPPDTFLLRQVRPVLEGTIRDHLDFRLLPDFAGGKVVVQEAWADVRYLTFLKLRVGKFKEPISLERIQNSNAVVFVERAYVTDIAPNRNVGAQLFGDIDGLLSYEVAAFNGCAPSDNSTCSADIDNADNKEVAARVFALPFATTDWDALKGFGLGASGSAAAPRGSTSSTLLPSYLSVGQQTIFTYSTVAGKTTYADGIHQRWNFQGYYYWSLIGLQAEYITELQRLRNGTTDINALNRAWEVTGEIVLTGENATFRMLVPNTPFDPGHGGWGAVELTGRYHELVFDTQAFALGFADPTANVRAAHAWGAGMNWYFDRALRFMFDFDRSLYFGGAKTGDRPPENVFMVRSQIVF